MGHLVWIGLLLAVVAAGVVRCNGLGAEDFWFDELHTLADSAARRGELEALPHGVVLRGVPRFTDLTPASTLASVWRGMAEDAHPPLYFVITHAWRRWFGDTEGAVRSLSVLCSLLTFIPLALLLGGTSWRRFSAAVLVVMTFSYADVFMAQQARPYALAMLPVCWASFLLLRMESRWAGPTCWIRVALAVAYGVALLCAMLTHYFAALPLLAHAAYGLVRFRGRLLASWLAACLTAVGAWMLIWGPTFLLQRAMIADQPWLFEDRTNHLIRTLARGADLPIRLLFDHTHFTVSATRSISGIGLLLAAAWLMRRSKRRGPRVALPLIVALLYAVPTLILLVIDLGSGRQMLAHLRYAYFAWPGLVGLIALAVARLSHRGRFVAVAAFAVAAAFTLRLPTQRTPDARIAAAIIEQSSEPGDVLLYEAIGWPQRWSSRMYAEVSYHLREVDPPFVMLHEPPGDSLLQDLRTFDRIIVVCPRPGVNPNPLPGTFELVQRPWGYIDQVGWIYVFGRAGDAR